MKRAVLVLAVAMVLVGMLAVPALANDVTPSTNDINRTKGWAHFNVVDKGPGYAEIQFVSTRGFPSCFEYRADGAATTDPRDNFNTDVTDGLWPFYCVNNSITTKTITADEYIDIRMVFGAESDERFDWTRVYVLPSEGKATGGVKFMAKSTEVQLNFTAILKDGNAKGIVGYSASNGNEFKGEVTGYFQSGNAAVFTGTVTKTNLDDAKYFRVQVRDNGEGTTEPTDEAIRVQTGSSPFATQFDGGGHYTIHAGNIQVH